MVLNPFTVGFSNSMPDISGCAERVGVLIIMRHFLSKVRYSAVESFQMKQGGLIMENDNQPKNSAHPLYMLLHSEEIEEFNTQREIHDDFSVLKGLDFRGLDLRGAELNGFDLSDGYFRQTDLRGLDLRTCNLEGASLRSAKISGTYFPDELSPDEILMSLNHGTRLRYR